MGERIGFSEHLTHGPSHADIGAHRRLKAEFQVAVMWAICADDGDLSPITPCDREKKYIVHGSEEWWRKWQVSTEAEVSKIDLKLNDMGFDAVRAVFS